MSAHADVTIVIPCFNYGRFLPEAVASALEQDGGQPEVIVVDDGSTDPHTQTVLEELPAGVELIRQQNGGTARARNAGARAASGELLLMLDADDRLDPGALAALKKPLATDRSLGFAYGRTRCFGSMSGELDFPAYDPFRLLYRSLVTVTSLVRREAFDQVGGFDPEIPGYEDWDFYLSLLAKGWEGRRIEQVTLHYRRHDESAFAGDRSDYRRCWRELRRKHSALYEHSRELGQRSDLGAVGRLLYRAYWGPRPLPAGLEQALYKRLLR